MAPIPSQVYNFLGCCFDLRFFSKTKFKNAKKKKKTNKKQCISFQNYLQKNDRNTVKFNFCDVIECSIRVYNFILSSKKIYILHPEFTVNRKEWFIEHKNKISTV